MRRSRRAAAALLSLGLILPGASAYAGSTGDGAGGASAEESGVVAAQAAVRPTVAPAPEPTLQAVSSGLAVDPAVVSAEIQDELGNTWLGDSLGLTIRDVATGEHLVDRNSDAGLTPASTTKLLAAAAIVSSLPMDQPFRTRVLTGPEPDQIVLTAGGDMMLAGGLGDPDLVEGHAGLGDLAEQTATALAAQGLGTQESPVRLRLDTSYGEGPRAPGGWTDYWLSEGFAGPITMLGLQQHRAIPYDPSPQDPAQAAAMRFRVELTDRGVVVGGGPETEVPRLTAPADAALLAEVESAPARDVLAEAMASSDNGMVEQLARQAAIADGADGDPAAVRDWVLEQIAASGIDTSGVTLADVSGLSDGSSIPVRVLGDLLILGADGSHPELQQVLRDLPIAGYSGTLWDRFALESQAPAVGVARAKTGALPGVTSLAGLVVTDDGRLLAYAVIADGVGEDGTSGLEARSALDSVIAELASCGC